MILIYDCTAKCFKKQSASFLVGRQSGKLRSRPAFDRNETPARTRNRWDLDHVLGRLSGQSCQLRLPWPLLILMRSVRSRHFTTFIYMFGVPARRPFSSFCLCRAGVMRKAKIGWSGRDVATGAGVITRIPFSEGVHRPMVY